MRPTLRLVFTFRVLPVSRSNTALSFESVAIVFVFKFFTVVFFPPVLATPIS